MTGALFKAAKLRDLRALDPVLLRWGR